MTRRCDLLIVGGGINGAAIARAAARAGLDVALVEKNDLGSGTSSASTKLIHGGLRYLEQREFRLVRESLQEREVLLRTAPHIVEPLEFVLPISRGSRSWPLLRAGLLLYDLLAIGGSLQRSRKAEASAGGSDFAPALAYWDARVDDSRLVVLNALDAAEHGATILTRHELIQGRHEGAIWQLVVEDAQGERYDYEARAVVNAAGPRSAAVLDQVLDQARDARLRLVRGSHIVVDRRLPDERAWLLQQEDGRIVFLIPYQGAFTLIGTTDVSVSSPDAIDASADEIRYLLDAASAQFPGFAKTEDIVWCFGGIRALYDDGTSDPSAVTRDYHFEIDRARNLLSVFGGKITTARRLATQALAAIGLPSGETSQTPLPGGDLISLADLVERASRRWGRLFPGQAERLARAYGNRIWTIFQGASDFDGLGFHFGHGLTECEVRYLREREWARTAEDVLWRRTKLGLLFSDGETSRLNEFMRSTAP